jgi:antirestriction protein ArdC
MAFFKKKDEKTGKVKTIPFCRNIPVFNVEQTENMKIKPLEELLSEKLNVNMTHNEIVLKIYEKLGVDSNIKSGEISNEAYYIPSEDRIVLPSVQQYNSPVEWNCTALHELIHWTGHETRCERKLAQYKYDISEKAFEELIAELGSMFLQMTLNLDGWMNNQNVAYIAGWKSQIKEDKKGSRFIYKACKLAEEAANYILKNSDILKEIEEKVEEEVA